MKALVRFLLLPFLALPLFGEEKEKAVNPLEKLKLPGIKINLEEHCLDVTSTVCLDEGSLEFVACTKGTKEHEAILRIEAKPSHIHTALLLLGAKAGHPAIRRVVGEGDDQRWIDVPARGSPVSVFFVVSGKDGKPVERPLSDFVTRNEEEKDDVKEDAKDRLKSFLFAGSHLIGEGDRPKTYLADKSGSVISLSTFGDEVLCLPEIYGHENHALQWQIDSTHLPRIDTAIILRLRPQGGKKSDETPSDASRGKGSPAPASR